MKKQCIFIFLCSLSSLFGQKDKVYSDFNEALKRPMDVYKLDLSYTKLRKVPEELAQFSNLEELDLSNNKITFVSSSIGRLLKLKQLNSQTTNTK